MEKVQAKKTFDIMTLIENARHPQKWVRAVGGAGLLGVALTMLFGLSLLAIAASAPDSTVLHLGGRAYHQLRKGASVPDPTALPGGATMRGIWGPSGQLDATATGRQISTISFPMLLPSTPTFHPMTHWMLWNQSTKACPGLIDGLPQAAPGHLCVYQTNTDALSNVESKTAEWSRLGVRLVLQGPHNRSFPIAEGTWAVTAP